MEYIQYLVGIAIGAAGFLLAKLWDHLKEGSDDKVEDLRLDAEREKAIALALQKIEFKLDLVLDGQRKIEGRVEKNESDADAAHEKIRDLERAVFPVGH